MFFREISDDIKVSLTIPQYADDIFSLIARNKAYLKVWLTWLDAVQDSSDISSFIASRLCQFYKGESLHETIFYKNKVAGVLGFNSIDRVNGIGYVGYWLGEEFAGKGIMTLAVHDLIVLGFDYFSLQRIDIRCAEENMKSRAIPERLGFSNEGVIRNAQLVNGSYHNHVIYGLLKKQNQN